jgi:hypothetical protein
MQLDPLSCSKRATLHLSMFCFISPNSRVSSVRLQAGCRRDPRSQVSLQLHLDSSIMQLLELLLFLFVMSMQLLPALEGSHEIDCVHR